MEEISSQNSDLGLEDLDKLEAKGQAENTKRATSWGIKKFEKWCYKRKLKVDFNCVTPVELNELLRKFYAEVKSEKGQPLTPSTLTGIRAAIHRQLTSAPISRSMNIMQDSEFLSANKMFEAKCKLYTKEMNPKPTHKSSIAAGDMLKLRGYFSEGLDSNNSWADPERLLQFVWFSLCFHFGRRGREGWRELSKQSFGIKTDDSGARYVTETKTEQTKNYQGGSKQKDQAYSDVRMYENSTPLDRVGSFEFYISRLHPSCQALFQIPNHHFKKAESRCVLWTSAHTNLSKLTFVNTFRRRKYRQDWRSHFSFANTAESFSPFSPAISKLHSAHSNRNYERLSWGRPFSTY
ncbi:unnamed protein product [Porites lobata]|uniref:Ndc10 domain-containing protein n=1 Tax=Porites lobata TaxID=104759 RepID=A0ABN8S5Z8_9CNID|nr:unnamed protein product [Porites lobata]